MNDHDIRVSARTAQLRASDGDADDGPPYTFSGVAVAAGDILHMDDGTPVLFTEEELRKAAETQAGEPLSVDHPEDINGRPQYPPPTSETVGKVPKAGWLESQQAVGYEATTHDEAIAKGVQAGSYDVSVHPTFTLGEQDPETGAYIAQEIRFRDLSVVSKGDSPSNSVQWGPNQALASFTRETDIGAVLTASADPDSDGGQEGLIASTVRGTLQALGIQPAELEASESTGDEPAESGADGSPSTMDNREDTISALADEHDFDEEWLEEADDDHLERLHESFVESADDGQSTDTPGDGAGADTDPDGGDGTTLADMTVDDLAEGLEERGFVTEENADQVVAQATRQTEKSKKVEEIIANSEDFDEEDRESLLASADKVVDREYQRVTGRGAAGLPGNAGALTAAAPNGSDDGLDAYGTGVQGDD